MYLLLIVLITFSGYILGMYEENRTKIRRFLYFSFFCIGFLIAFRGSNVGADTESYIRWFSNSQLYANASEFPLEKGNYFLFIVLGHISNNPQIIFVFEAIVVGVCYGYFIYKNVDSILEAYIAVLSYLSFQLFAFNLTGYRQSIAMCICAIAYKFIEEKKPVKFLLTVAFASLFHSSAWFLIAAYGISLVGNRLGKIIAAIFTVFALRNFNTIFALTAMIDNRYEKYGIEETGNGFIFWSVILVVLIFVELGKKKYECSYQMSKLININYFCFGLWCLRLFTRVAERPAMYFLPSTMMLTSYIPKMYAYVFDEKSYKLFKVTLCGLLIILFLVRSSRIPYTFCW